MKIKLSQKQLKALQKGSKLVGQIEELDRCRPHIGTFRYVQRRNTLAERLEKLISSQTRKSTVIGTDNQQKSFCFSLLGAMGNSPKVVQYLKRK